VQREFGLIEYAAVVGLVLAIAVFELISLIRLQRRDRRMRNGNSDRTHSD
jgi:hypothetical protein